MEPVPTSCDHCGDVDDHPKLHYGDETYHHHCIPARVRADVSRHPVVASILSASDDGRRGQSLRDYIKNLHEES